MEAIFSSVLFLLAAVFLAILLGRGLARVFHQPDVLGELTVGILLGNVAYALDLPFAHVVMNLEETMHLLFEVWRTGLSPVAAAPHVFDAHAMAQGGSGQQVLAAITGAGSANLALAFALWLFSHLGVILLLFMVGLESSVHEMLAVGYRALLVAVLGVVVPFATGIFVSSWLLPDLPFSTDIFLGAVLTATSVGITARVLRDLNKLNLPEAKVILGAAVIDDVLGLIVLAVVSGIVATGHFQPEAVIKLCLVSFGYLAVIVGLGERVMPILIRPLRKFDPAAVRFLVPLFILFIVSWSAGLIGLAPIVGAFAAGLILKDSYFPTSQSSPALQASFQPLESFLAPIFFVVMGLQVNLQTFLQTETLFFAIALIAVAVIGKLAAGLGAGKNLDRLTIGIGMVPRGEVGLIFASVGKSLGVISPPIFSAIVMMVVVTTFVSPFALQWALKRKKS